MKTSPVSLPRRRTPARWLTFLVTALLTTTGWVPAHESPRQKPEPGERLLPETILQLESARQTAARFFDVKVALAEGYVDINVVIPHMGRHLLNAELLDGRFDPNKPELLVYQEDCDGTLRLAALEYAIPTDLSPKAPRGFAGESDVWFNDTGFQLWTLHAWVYDFNPAGVFSPDNPRLP